MACFHKVDIFIKKRKIDIVIYLLIIIKAFE